MCHDKAVENPKAHQRTACCSWEAEKSSLASCPVCVNYHKSGKFYLKNNYLDLSMHATIFILDTIIEICQWLWLESKFHHFAKWRYKRLINWP